MTRYARWSRDGMPDDAANYRIQKGIDATMQSVVANRSIPTSASMIPDQQRAAEGPPRPASGGTVPIGPPPGIEHVDRLVDAQDRRDRIAAIRRAAEDAEIERRLDRKEPYRCQTEYAPFSAENMKK